MIFQKLGSIKSFMKIRQNSGFRRLHAEFGLGIGIEEDNNVIWS